MVLARLHIMYNIEDAEVYIASGHNGALEPEKRTNFSWSCAMY